MVELAERLRISPQVALAMLETEAPAPYFPGAWREENGWRIPVRALRAYLGRQMEPLFTLAEVATYLGVHKTTVEKAAQAHRAGDSSGIATVEIRLPGSVSKRIPRVTLSELQRHIAPAL